VSDDANQYRLAHQFFAQRSMEDPAYVCLVVLIEFVWSLRRSYRYSESDAREAVRRMMSAADILLEKHELVEECMMAANSDLGLADLLIAAGNLAEGCSHTVTFDKVAARGIPSMELLA
jgi:predicted nucleic-acid-binding protein